MIKLTKQASRVGRIHTVRLTVQHRLHIGWRYNVMQTGTDVIRRIAGTYRYIARCAYRTLIYYTMLNLPHCAPASTAASEYTVCSHTSLLCLHCSINRILQ